MNILITAPSLNPDKNVSGISSVVQNIINYNKTQTYFHYLLGRPDKPLKKIMFFRRFLKQLFYFPFFLKKHKIQLVHQNFPLEPKGVIRESIISFWCFIFKKPVLLHVHGGRFICIKANIFFSFLIKQIIRNSKKVIVLSKHEKQVLADYYNYKEALVLPNSINTSIYDKSHVQRKTEVPVFLYLGRIEINKGVNELIDALTLLEKDHKFQFYLCGDGPMKDLLVDSMNKLLGENFKYYGVVSGQKKVNIIKKSTFFLLPSYFEGLPMALLETMAAGVIPITTNVGSIGNIITNGYNGIFIEKKNTADLYHKMKTALHQDINYKTLSPNAKKTIQDNYDIKNYIKMLNNIYKPLIIKTKKTHLI